MRGRFEKGNIPHNKKEPIQKVCKCGKQFSVKPSLRHVQSCSISCSKRGTTASLKQREIASAIMKGNKHRVGKVSWNKGNKGYMAGEKHYLYKKDRTQLKKYGDANKDRRSSAYVWWRKSVWLRDNYTCKIANPNCEGRIEAHHILGYTQFPELRYKINNGITLCHAHHPRKRAEEKRLIPTFIELVSVSKSSI